MTRALQQTIHVACRQLGLDQDDRRDLQLQVCGKASMKDMGEEDLKAVLKHLEKAGFKKQPRRTKAFKPAPRSDLKLIHVLWRKLGEKGALERPGRAGLNAFIRSRFGDAWASVPADVDMIRDQEQITAVIRALKAWGKRADIDFDFARSPHR